VAPWSLISKVPKVEVSSGKSGFRVQINQFKVKKNTFQAKKKNKLKASKAKVKRKSKSSAPSLKRDKGAITSSKILNRVVPNYPYKSRIFVEEGIVQVEVQLNPFGKVLSVKVLQSSSYERLDHAALEASRKSVFQSAKRFGENVASVHILDFKFELND